MPRKLSCCLLADTVRPAVTARRPRWRRTHRAQAVTLNASRSTLPWQPRKAFSEGLSRTQAAPAADQTTSLPAYDFIHPAAPRGATKQLCPYCNGTAPHPKRGISAFGVHRYRRRSFVLPGPWHAARRTPSLDSESLGKRAGACPPETLPWRASSAAKKPEGPLSA